MYFKENGFYTGVGSRKAPLCFLYLFSLLAQIFENKGIRLRSGGALGSDLAFSNALSAPELNSQIFVTSNIDKPHYYNPKTMYGLSFDGLYRQAMRLIMDNRLHKKWENCTQIAFDLHNRNVFQVLGLDLKTPSEFLICWTPGGEKKYSETSQLTGGTATAINTAAVNGVPVFNLADKVDLIYTLDFILKNIDCVDFDKVYSITPASKVVAQTPYGVQLAVIASELNSVVSGYGFDLDRSSLSSLFPSI